MRKIKKIKLAVTGGIGSGKTVFCGFLKSEGIPVINVDDVSKELLENDKDIIKKIIQTFGKESYVGGKPDKKFLAEKVFSNTENVLKINSILHPKVIKKVDILAGELLKKNDIVAAEAALIYEANMESHFDYIVLITADINLRMKRKTEIEKYLPEQFTKRNENQIPEEEKAECADFVFENNGNLIDLKNKAFLFSNIVKGLISIND
ncbi:MAG: dephospho-CoA kinase [Ignavibacteriaceae bacterium]|jgi:dephospho-CoA kinase